MADTLTILYATETGNAEDLAEQVRDKAREQGFETRLENVADYDVGGLPGEKRVVLIASTWGDGDPPDEAVDFGEAVIDGELDLSGLEFAVCALGDTSYEDFCGFGKRLDEAFEKHGGRRIVERVDLDVDFEEGFEAWRDQLFAKLPAPA